MFPLSDLEGKVVGFSGRIYNKEDVSKYINSKESEIFKKGEILYNYHRAKDFARRQRSVIITEGFMDVIGLYKVGIRNVIATMGTAVTSNQASIIKKMSSNVILCFDGDDAGEKATLLCSMELIKCGVIPKIVRLPEGLDPDDYVKKYGVDKFKEYLDGSKNYLDYKIEYYKRNTNFDDSESVSDYIKNVIDELENEQDKIIRELILKNLSEDTKISIITLNNLLKNKNFDLKPKRIEKKKELLDKFQKAEGRLIFYMLRYEEVLKLYEKNKCFFPTQKFRFLVSELLSFYNKYNKLNIADFITFLNGKTELIEALSIVDNMDIPENYLMEEINDYIRLLNTYGVELEAKRLNNVFKSETDENEKLKIAKKIADLKVSE
jgi:DNA primase